MIKGLFEFDGYHRVLGLIQPIHLLDLGLPAIVNSLFVQTYLANEADSELTTCCINVP